MMRPLADHQEAHAIDESTDASDTVAWLVKNLPNNNGRVGVVGTSYPGFLAHDGRHRSHPAVKAISPQAPMIDVWIGDDFFHNGAFRQSYGYDYVLGMESNKTVGRVNYGDGARGNPIDGFDYFLSRGSFLADVRQSGSRILPTWKLFLDHPAYDDYWCARAVEYALNSVTVPTLSVGGYYDQEDMWGSQEEYAKLEPHNTAHDNFLVLGPWRHGYWSSSSRSLGNLDFGEPIGTEFREQIESKFFAHYLKGRVRLQSSEHRQLPDRIEHLEVLRPIPSPGVPAPQPASRRRRPAQLAILNRIRFNFLRERSRQSRPLPPSPHPAHLLRRFPVVQLAH